MSNMRNKTMHKINKKLFWSDLTLAAIMLVIIYFGVVACEKEYKYIPNRVVNRY
jgi:hypothetical protein